MKLVCFGDSLTWLGYGGSYYEELVKLLPQHQWINAGDGGNTVINLLRRVDDDVLSHQPDGVFLMVGGNDAISFSQPKTRSYYRQAQGIPDGVVTPPQFEQAYRDLLTKLQLAHVVVWIGLEPCEYNLEVVAAFREYNARIQTIARAFTLPTLDLMGAFPPGDLPDRPPLEIGYILTIGAREKRGWHDYESARKAGGFRYTFDGMHLMPETARQMAALIAAFIEEQLVDQQLCAPAPRITH